MMDIFILIIRNKVITLIIIHIVHTDPGFDSKISPGA